MRNKDKFEVKIFEREPGKETLVAHWHLLEPGVNPYDSGLGKFRIEFNKQ